MRGQICHLIQHTFVLVSSTLLAGKALLQSDYERILQYQNRVIMLAYEYIHELEIPTRSSWLLLMRTLYILLSAILTHCQHICTKHETLPFMFHNQSTVRVVQNQTFHLLTDTIYFRDTTVIPFVVCIYLVQVRLPKWYPYE